MDGDELRSALERHHRESFGWALACCGRDPAEAEEVLQMVYLKVLSGRARFDGRASFKTWLLALVRHTAVDAWREKRRRKLRLLPLDGETDPQAEDESPEESADRLHAAGVLRDALSALPARQKEVLRLVFYHELSLSEAALVMGVSLGSARTHYERGKKSLRERLLQTKVFDEPGL